MTRLSSITADRRGYETGDCWNRHWRGLVRYPNIVELAAAYTTGIVKNHPFWTATNDRIFCSGRLPGSQRLSHRCHQRNERCCSQPGGGIVERGGLRRLPGIGRRALIVPGPNLSPLAMNRFPTSSQRPARAMGKTRSEAATVRKSTRRPRDPKLGRGAGWNAYLASAKQRENPPERFLPNRITSSG